MPITAANPFKWRHYPGDIIMWCVRWYLRYPISVAQMGEMARERGLAISPSCVWRWVQTYGPELDKRCRPHLKPTNRSWRVDETYIKVKGQERFLYRAVDSTGQTIDFLLTAKRDTAAAKRFFQRGMANPGNSIPRRHASKFWELGGTAGCFPKASLAKFIRHLQRGVALQLLRRIHRRPFGAEALPRRSNQIGHHGYSSEVRKGTPVHREGPRRNHSRNGH
jgi:hypothetical protein